MKRYLAYFFVAACIILLQGCLSNRANQFDAGRTSFVEGDYHQAFRRLQPLAQQNNPEAQYAIGYMYFYGLGTVQDHQRAMQWIGAAARSGQPQAKKALSDLSNYDSNSRRGFTIQRPPALGMYPGPQQQPSRKSYGPRPSSDGWDEQRKSASWPPPRQSDQSGSAVNKTVVPASGNQAPKSISPSDAVDDLLLEEPSSDASSASLTPQQAKSPARKVVTRTQTMLPSEAKPQPVHTAAVKPAQKHYTVQLMGAYKEQQLEQFIARNHLQGKVNKFHTKNNGRDWYVVGYGEFSSPRAAKEAIQNLPEPLRQVKPWVRGTSSLEHQG